MADDWTSVGQPQSDTQSDDWVSVGSKSSDAKPEIGAGEAFGRGAAQAFGLGYSPQLIAALKTGRMPGGEDPEYLKELAKQKAATEQAWEQHPWLYGTGMVASAIPAAASAIMSAPEAAAAGTAGLGARLLASGSNLGSLGGAGLRAVAGESAGLAPSALRGTAAALENPVVQGAIMGSAEGENLSEKAAGAAFGAAGAKIAPAVLGAAGSAVKAAGSKIAPDIVDPIFSVLTGSQSAAKTAGNIANDLGVSLPSGALSESGLQALGTKADFFAQVPKAASKTLNEIGGKVTDFAGDVNRKDTGAAIRSAVQNWATDVESPNSFVSQMREVYAPIRALESSSAIAPPSALSSAIGKVNRSTIGQVSDLTPTLNIARIPMGLADDQGGLTFAQMKAFREVLSDTIDWNQTPGTSGINNNILKELRAAVTKDMAQAAEKIGGQEAADAFSNVNANAQNLYNQRSSIFKITGNPNVAGAGAKDDDAIYRAIIGAAGKKGGKNIADLGNLQKAVSQYDPDAWASVGKAYASDFAPNGQFSFGNFNKMYDSYFHPQGKDLIFGTPEGPGFRSTLDAIHSLGSMNAKNVPLGTKLDALAAKAGQQPSLSGAILESAISGGIPLKSATAAVLGTGASALGARNIAGPASKYVPSQAEKIAAETLRRSAPLVGAQGLNPVGTVHQDRMGRKSGGRVSDRLVMAVDRAKKNINNDTKSLLGAHDTHVAQALEIANRNIEG